MSHCSRRALPGALVLLSLVLPSTALALPVTVNLRVEGPTATVFDGPVTTDGHAVTTAAAGTHPCDGTNGGAQPSAGPTATAALDDAARAGGFTIDGPYGNFGIDDFFIERVADQQIDPTTAYWSLWINQAFSDLGGCQKRVLAGQDVLWAGIPFSVDVPLRLEGSNTATVGRPVNVRVIDGQTKVPQAGATVGGVTTNANGIATLSFAQRGIYRLKASKPDTIRSNTIVMCVDPEGADPCSSTDATGPVVAVGAAGGQRGGLASTRGRSRTMLISWAGDDRSGSGVRYYSVEVAEAGETTWRSLLDKSPANGLHFRGDVGATYRFRITATDRALNETTVVSEPVTVPVDDRNRSLWRFSKGDWRRIRRAQAWGGTVIRAADEGATARFSFEGTEVALVGRRLPKGGRLRLTVDGRSRVLRTRGRSAYRTVLWSADGLGDGRHRLSLRSLGGGPVELDAVAPSP